MTPSRLELADQFEEFLRGLRIEPRGRLVENGDLGLLDDDLGQSEPLAHAARKRRDALFGDIGQPHPRQRRRDAPLPFVKGKPHQLRGIGQVLDGGEVVVEADRVGQIADPALDLERRARRIVAEHADLA